MNNSSPPRFAHWLLTKLHPDDTLEEVEGDLDELYTYWSARSGKTQATIRYLLNVVSVLPPFVRKREQEHKSYSNLTTAMLRNYLKIAYRTLQKHRLYSLLNIGGLAIGMACCLLIALYILDELSYDRFNPNYSRIYRVVEKQKQADGIYDVAVTPGPLAASLKKDFPEVELTTRIGRWSGLLTHGRQAIEPEKMLIVDPSFFALFDFPLLLGDVTTAFQGPDEVIFSEGMAERFYGKDWPYKHILGQLIQLNTQQTLKLVGVARNPPSRSHIQFDVLLPFKWLEKNDEWSMKWNSNSYHTYLQLRPELTNTSAGLEQFAHKIRNSLQRYVNGDKTQLILQPLSAIYLHSKFSFETDWGKRSNIVYVRIFIVVGLIVLLIAIINFINLATARASGRAKEVGVRKTIGAQQINLIGQFLGEALLTTGLAVGLAVFLANFLVPLFNDISGKVLQIPYHLGLFWILLVGITGVVSLLTGLYPAFVLSSFRPVTVLKGVFNAGKGRRFRQILVIGQFVLSVSMGIATVVIYKQLRFIQTAKIGFDKEHLIYLRLKGDLRAKAWTFKQQVEQLPGVARASLTTSNLVGITNSAFVEWEGQAPKDEFLMTNMNIDQDFVSTVGMKVLAGRNFSAQIPSDTSGKLGAYLINETAAKRMGWTLRTALGKRIKHWGQDGLVIGVLKDFHFRPLHVAIEPFIFRYQPSNPYFNLLVKTEPGAVGQTLSRLAAVYKKNEPVSPFSYGFVNQDLDAQYKAEQRAGRIILYFAMLAILIACLGLFGLAAFTAEQRMKEIGVRKILGASIVSLIALLSQDFLKLVLIAILIASPIAWWCMNQWLNEFAYKVTIDWWLFALAGSLAVGIALLTVSFQSIKAALMNPVKSLRSE
jgi:ABC-type antimicrobial peptide transport system permease subunit